MSAKGGPRTAAVERGSSRQGDVVGDDERVVAVGHQFGFGEVAGDVGADQRGVGRGSETGADLVGSRSAAAWVGVGDRIGHARDRRRRGPERVRCRAPVRARGRRWVEVEATEQAVVAPTTCATRTGGPRSSGRVAGGCSSGVSRTCRYCRHEGGELDAVAWRAVASSFASLSGVATPRAVAGALGQLALGEGGGEARHRRQAASQCDQPVGLAPLQPELPRHEGRNRPVQLPRPALQLGHHGHLLGLQLRDLRRQPPAASRPARRSRGPRARRHRPGRRSLHHGTCVRPYADPVTGIGGGPTEPR